MLCITTAYNYVAAGVLNSYGILSSFLHALRARIPIESTLSFSLCQVTSRKVLQTASTNHYSSIVPLPYYPSTTSIMDCFFRDKSLFLIGGSSPEQLLLPASL